MGLARVGRIEWLLVVLSFSSGCEGEGDDVGGDGDADTDADADADADLPPPTGTVTVASCSDLDDIGESCSWRYQFDDGRCTIATPCSKLVAFFAGGDQACQNYDGILEAFVNDGYVAACLQIFETADGSALEPYLDEAPRVDAVLADFVRSDVVRAVWDGQDLLIAGVSHGATAPVIAMARTDLDDQAHWRGARKTGACFYDGIYDIGALDELLGTGGVLGRECDLPLSHARAVGRYYDHPPDGHACDNDQCVCDPDHALAMDEDTIVDAPPSGLAIADWMLIECGSAMAACIGDVVPGPPIEDLCARIDGDAGHACAFEGLPDVGHIRCAADRTDLCMDWFDAL